ncbi:hypothetical protein QFZ73_003643 [Peribacillus sp. V2I11]|nr:hypothetical protein [Peribacillus sp. V2I11]
MLFLPGKISTEKRRAILNKIKSFLHPLLERRRKLFFAIYPLVWAVLMNLRCLLVSSAVLLVSLRCLLVSLRCLLVSLRCLLVRFCCFTREFALFTREFALFTRDFVLHHEFELFTREFRTFTREFELFTREYYCFTREFILDYDSARLLVPYFYHAKKGPNLVLFCLFLYACDNWRRRASYIPLEHAGHIFHERPRGNSIYLLLFLFHPSSASLLAFNWRLHASPVLC